MTLTERLDAFIEKNIVPINIYGSDMIIGVGLGLALSAGYVGEFSSEMNLGMYTAVVGVCLRIGAGHIKRLSEANERAIELSNRVDFQVIDLRNGFYEA